MKSGLVIILNVQAWHADSVVDARRIVRNVEENIRLSSTYIPILDAFAYHVGEELGHNGSGKSSRCECKSLTLLVNHITIRLDL
jgi:hypothetical protein